MSRLTSCAEGIALFLSIIVVSAHPASAISRVNSTSHTCAALRQIIDSRGAIILTHPGSRQSGTLYDRYVRDSSYCDPSTVATDDWVPAKDRSCRLYNCQTYEPPFDD
ncbi:hypothetical protein [Rhizobium leucaenae]|uniref:Uncharacterized protein n=1 Tax=Rhizobium leucaenae TaxID=29450 RepID=A0A7W7EKX5_9HYPH|nr:hypothetical protein [Rhizobium leucaenae]MBB4569355.1 hypothetical protein [Rhizobium leucaenae]MBB6302807.1 hypothetical protein [Rhizobium leucaenae]